MTPNRARSAASGPVEFHEHEVDHAQPDAAEEGDGERFHPRPRPRPAPGGAGTGPATAGATEPWNGACRRNVSVGQAPDYPHHRRQPADRDAEEPGPVDVLGRGPHGHAGIGAQEEPGQGHDDPGTARDDQDV